MSDIKHRLFVHLYIWISAVAISTYIMTISNMYGGSVFAIIYTIGCLVMQELVIVDEKRILLKEVRYKPSIDIQPESVGQINDSCTKCGQLVPITSTGQYDRLRQQRESLFNGE